MCLIVCVHFYTISSDSCARRTNGNCPWWERSTTWVSSSACPCPGSSLTSESRSLQRVTYFKGPDVEFTCVRFYAGSDESSPWSWLPPRRPRFASSSRTRSAIWCSWPWSYCRQPCPAECTWWLLCWVKRSSLVFLQYIYIIMYSNSCLEHDAACERFCCRAPRAGLSRFFMTREDLDYKHSTFNHIYYHRFW